MMDCRGAKELWESEPLETLDAERRAELDLHAAGCRDCGAEIALLESIRGELPAAARPYRPRSLWTRRLVPAAAAAVLVAGLAWSLFHDARSAGDLDRRLAAHVTAARSFVRQLENLRGEDPARDRRLVAAEWRISGLKDATIALPAAEVARRYGPEAGRYVESFVRVGEMIEAGCSVRDLQVTVKPGEVEGLAAKLPPVPDPSPRLILPAEAGGDDVARFATARAYLYAGEMKEAESLFTLFCSEYPSSPYASDAAYWGWECAKDQGDMKALVRFLGRITEEEWMDAGVVGDVGIVLGQPGIQVFASPDGPTLLEVVDGEESGTIPFTFSVKLLEKVNGLKRSPSPSPAPSK